MIRLLVLFSILLATACNRLSNSSTDPSVNLPSAETTTGLNEQGPLSTTTATPPPAVNRTNDSGTNPRSVEPQTYGQSAVLAPGQGLSEDEASVLSLQGNWQNQADEGETIQFNPDTYIVYFEGQPVVEEAVVYHTNCPSECSGGTVADYPCFVVSSPYSTDCFAIVRLTTNEMELTLLGQSTATVLYSRITP